MKSVWKLVDLDCAVCAQKMQDAVSKMEEVESCMVNFLMQNITVYTSEDVDIGKLKKKIGKAIRKIEPDCSLEEK